MKMKYMIFIIMCIVLCSCRSVKYIEKEVPIEIPIVKTQKEYVQMIDTVIQKDSIFIQKYTSNDTVYIDKLQLKDVFKKQIIRDTITTNDTITVPVTVKVKDITAQTKAETERDAWRKTAKSFSYLSLVLMIVAIVSNWSRLKKYLK